MKWRRAKLVPCKKALKCHTLLGAGSFITTGYFFFTNICAGILSECESYLKSIITLPPTHRNHINHINHINYCSAMFKVENGLLRSFGYSNVLEHETCNLQNTENFFPIEYFTPPEKLNICFPELHTMFLSGGQLNFRPSGRVS